MKETFLIIEELKYDINKVIKLLLDEMSGSASFGFQSCGTIEPEQTSTATVFKTFANYWIEVAGNRIRQMPQIPLECHFRSAYSSATKTTVSIILILFLKLPFSK